MHSGNNDPVAWANKRKVAIENAKKLREERAKGGAGSAIEDFSFTPQINKRPSYLGKETDALDKLTAANRVNYDPSDIMEQPLPGNRSKLLSPSGYVANYSSGATDAGKSGQLSPGSDALGKEMKNYPSSIPLNGVVAAQSDGYRGLPNASAHQGSQYKSKFLQQYDNNSVSSQSTNQAPYTQNNNNNNNAMNYNKPEDVDGAFFGSLRGGDRSSGPGWNDDTSTNGFVSKPVGTTKRSTGSRPRQQTTVTANHTVIDHASSHSASYADQRPSPRHTIQNSANHSRRSQAQPPLPRSDWNSGTEVMYPDPTPLKVSPRANGPVVRVSPRVAGSRVGAPSAAVNGDAVNQARSNLSLLKSKIRRSESGNIIRNASNRSSSSSDYANNNESDGSGAFQDRENRSAPSHNTNNRSFVDNAPRQHQQQQPVVSSNAGRKAVQPSKQKHDQPSGMPLDDEYRRTYPLQPQPKSSRVSIYEQETNPPNVNSSSSSYNYSSGNGSRYQPSAAFDDPMDVPTDSIGEQLECPDCGRRFNPAPYERHVKICAKVFLQKRKVFDSTKMRTKDDPELAKLAQQALKKEKQQQKMAQMKAAAPSNRNDGNVVRKGDSTGRSDLYHEPPSQNDSNIAKSKPSKPKQSSVDTEGVGNKSSKWKDQSKAFREAMRAARQVTQAIAEGKPLPPPVMSAPDPSLIPCPHCGRRFSEKAAERHIPQCQNIKAKPSSLKRGSGGVATTANAAGRKVTGRGGF